VARLRVSVTIRQPPRAVWAYLEQIERHPEWMRDCVAVRFEGRRRRGVGTHFVARTRVLGITLDDPMTVVRWERRRAIGVEHDGLVGGTGEFRLRPRLLGGTRVEWREELRFPRWMGGAIGALGAKPMLKWIWKGSLRNLKARLESR